MLKTWLTAINPLVDFALSADGELTFANAAAQPGVATPAKEYHIEWARFDNATDSSTPVRTVSVPEPRVRAPEAVLGMSAGEFVQVRVAAVHAEFPSWAKPVTVHFRRLADGWQLVGVARIP